MLRTNERARGGCLLCREGARLWCARGFIRTNERTRRVRVRVRVRAWAPSWLVGPRLRGIVIKCGVAALVKMRSAAAHLQIAALLLHTSRASAACIAFGNNRNACLNARPRGKDGSTCQWSRGKCRPAQWFEKHGGFFEAPMKAITVGESSRKAITASEEWMAEVRATARGPTGSPSPSTPMSFDQMSTRLSRLEQDFASRLAPFTAVRFLSVVPNKSTTHADRQRELLTALTRTCAHAGFRAVHLMVSSLQDLRHMLIGFAYVLPVKVKVVVELGRMPLNLDFVLYAATELNGETVLVTNDDVYPEGSAWNMLPEQSMMLSRHMKKHDTCDGCVKPQCNQRKAQEPQSLCNTGNFGSFDGWVHRFNGPQDWLHREVVDGPVTGMLTTPRHAFGADNLLGHVFEHYLGVRFFNRCLRYKLFHLHCRFPTSTRYGLPDNLTEGRGYGDGTVIGHRLVQQLLASYEKNLTRGEVHSITRRRWRVSW